jgi:hypothetical protein
MRSRYIKERKKRPEADRGPGQVGAQFIFGKRSTDVTRFGHLARLAALALGCVAGCANEPRGIEHPDVGFLEFLGSVDGLAELYADYPSGFPVPVVSDTRQMKQPNSNE